MSRLVTHWRTTRFEKTMHEFVAGTAGHIDHGKTALVRALTGQDPDRLPEEKRRGMTIDLGFASLEFGGDRLALVDVPGHERLVRNMLAGATGFDVAMLVIAADDSVMPQTREHLEILRLLELTRGLIVLTKCDLADADWLEMVEEDARELARGTFLEKVAIVRTSVKTGEGIEQLKGELRKLVLEGPRRTDHGPFRMAIDRGFSIAGHGTVVTGTVMSGEVALGDEVEWHPSGRIVRIRGLQNHGASVHNVSRGCRAAMNLAGIHHLEVHRGQELASPGYLVPTRVLGVEVRALDRAPWPLRHRGRYRLHLGTGEVGATLSLLEPSSLSPGEVGLGQIFVSQPVVATHGQPFVLRSESPSLTLGGGRILQPGFRRIRRKDRASLERLGRLRSTDLIERTEAVLSAQSTKPWSELDLVREAGLPMADIPQIFETIETRGNLIELPLGPRRLLRLHRACVLGLETRVLRAVEQCHQAHPRQSTIRRTHLINSLPGLGPDSLLVALIDRLIADGRLVGHARSIALTDFRPKLSQSERRAKDVIARTYSQSGLAPPDAEEFLSKLDMKPEILQELLQLLVEEGALVEVGAGLYLDAASETSMRERVTSRLSDGSGLTMAELRDLLGVTRKHAVPLGEYLDRIGLTVRQGDIRQLAAIASTRSRDESHPGRILQDEEP